MKRFTVLALVVAAPLFVGCDDKSPTPPTDTPKPRVETSAPGPGKMDQVKIEAVVAQEKAAEAKDAGAAKMTEMKDAGAAKAADAQATAVATAQKYYDEAKSMITSKNFTAAQDAIAKLEPLQPQLPAEWQPKINELKTMLQNAKTAGSLLPK